MNSLTKESLIVSLMSQRFKGGFSVLWDGSSADKQNFKSSCFKCCGHCHWLFSEFLGNRESLWLNSVDLPKEMQSLVGKLLFDELFHSATQLVIVPHNIKNSRLILRCLWFFREPTKTKTQKSFCTDWNLFLMNIQRMASITRNRKNISIQPLLLILLVIQVFHHTAFPPFSTSLWTISYFWVVHLQSCAALALILEIGLLSTIKPCCRLCKTDDLGTLSPVLTQFILSFCCYTVLVSCNV